MRVALVSRRFFPTISGMSVYALNLVRELARSGHDVTLFAQYRGDARGRRVYGGGPPPAVEGVRVVGLESLGEQDGGDFERDVAALVAAVEAEHARAPFDVLHAQYGYPPGLAVLEAGRRLGVPTVVSIQGGDGHWVGECCSYHRAAMRAVLRHAGVALIGSASFRRDVAARNGLPEDALTIVPGGVDTRAFSPRAAGSDAGEPVLVYHGRVDARKGVLDLLDAFAALDRPARLVISGIGPDTEAVERRVAALGLGDRVERTGYVAYDAVPAVYRRGDVFVSPTHAEGFSNTILEAMATGLPIVSCHAVGVVDCLRDGENGLLVPPGDAGALAAALRRLLDDPALRARLGGSALAEVRERYGWPALARAVVGEYERLEAAPPADGWELPAPDPACRYRAAPHLL